MSFMFEVSVSDSKAFPGSKESHASSARMKFANDHTKFNIVFFKQDFLVQPRIYLKSFSAIQGIN